MLGDFDPKATYDSAAVDYEDASRDYWQYLSSRTVDRLNLRPGERVLDVPCGTGASLVAAAERVGPSGRVVGVDYAERMLAIARANVEASGLPNVRLRVGDMTALEAPAEPYDAVACVLGVFFADDMAALVRSFLRLVRPGGRVAVAVFGEWFCAPLRDVFVAAVDRVAPGFDVIQPWKRTCDEATFRSLVDGAGAGQVSVETDDDTLPLPSADDWWRVVMGSALRRTIAALGPERASAVRAECEAFVAREGVTSVKTRSRYAILVR